MGDTRTVGEVRLGRLILGRGMPKICVPVMGKNNEEIAQAAKRAKDACADLIELRIDSMSPMPDAQMATVACAAVREAAGDVPLLFTLRTERDGGAGSTDAQAYEALLTDMIGSGACEAIDCELSIGRDAFVRIARHTKEVGVTLVGSSHEFGEIGNMERAAQWLFEQEALGADICKAAVMTKTNIQALEAALMFARAKEKLAIPMIGIAMGPSGVITRIGGACMGSCLTFGTAGKSSAPGQIDAMELRGILETIGRAVMRE